MDTTRCTIFEIVVSVGSEHGDYELGTNLTHSQIYTTWRRSEVETFTILIVRELLLQIPVGMNWSMSEPRDLIFIDHAPSQWVDHYYRTVSCSQVERLPCRENARMRWAVRLLKHARCLGACTGGAQLHATLCRSQGCSTSLAFATPSPPCDHLHLEAERGGCFHLNITSVSVEELRYSLRPEGQKWDAILRTN